MKTFLTHKLSLYYGANWQQIEFTTISIPVPAVTDTLYDVFVYGVGPTPVLELEAWTNDIGRNIALTTQDGIYVKSTDKTRRYLGSMRVTQTMGQSSSSIASSNGNGRYWG